MFMGRRQLLRFWKSPGFYQSTRSLHLYIGLFLSPLILIFALSVFVMNHDHPVSDPPTSVKETRTIDTLPENLESMDAVQVIMKQAGLSGWVTFYRHLKERNQFRFIVLRPTARRNVTVDLETRTLEIEKRPSGLKGTLYSLHTFPGPHTQEKNWFFLFLWWIFADSVAYGSIFLSVSGIYLWYFLKKERKIGLVLITLGMLSFGLLLAPLVG
jgi:hypothetical protein